MTVQGMPVQRRLVFGGLSALAAGVGAAAVLHHYSRKWIMPPRVVLDAPQGDTCEEVRFAAEDGTPLYG
ncbi:MAG: hypothetical protein C4290_04825, partial [Chloroflexota bacterium]